MEWYLKRSLDESFDFKHFCAAFNNTNDDEGKSEEEELNVDLLLPSARPSYTYSPSHETIRSFYTSHFSNSTYQTAPSSMPT